MDSIRFCASCAHYFFSNCVLSTCCPHFLAKFIKLSILHQDRLAMENKSHATEIMQKTRIALENGEVSKAEQDDSIRVSL